jgi:hypothetical protein
VVWCRGTPRPRFFCTGHARWPPPPTRVGALSWASRPFALRAGSTVRMRRSRGSTGHPTDRRRRGAPRSRRLARVATSAPRRRRRVRGTRPRTSRRARAAAGQFARCEQPTGSTVALARADGVKPFDLTATIGSRTRRLRRDATRVGGRSGLADVERPESNTKSRCRERAFRARVRRPRWSPGRVGLVRNRQGRSERRRVADERAEPAVGRWPR